MGAAGCFDTTEPKAPLKRSGTSSRKITEFYGQPKHAKVARHLNIGTACTSRPTRFQLSPTEILLALLAGIEQVLETTPAVARMTTVEEIVAYTDVHSGAVATGVTVVAIWFCAAILW